MLQSFLGAVIPLGLRMFSDHQWHTATPPTTGEDPAGAESVTKPARRRPARRVSGIRICLRRQNRAARRKTRGSGFDADALLHRESVGFLVRLRLHR